MKQKLQFYLVAVLLLTATFVNGQVRITEAMSSSGTGGTADWFELTNLGTTTVDITGWKVDDSSFAFATSLALNGVTSIPAGKSVVFMETAAPDTDIPAFKTFWGSSMNNVSVGSYTGSGIGLSSSADGVVIYKADGTEVNRVSFNAATNGSSFYWSYKEDGTLVDNGIVSVEGTIMNQVTLKSTNALNNIGSPGTADIIPVAKIIRITEAMSSAGGTGVAGIDWFELTNLSTIDIDITGWKVDDSSAAFTTALALNGVTSIPVGKSVIFMETAAPDTDIPAFKTFWGSSLDNVSVGSYTGSGIGLSSSGDGVTIFKTDGTEVTRVTFVAATTGSSFFWSYSADGTMVSAATGVVSTVGTITGTISNQVTLTSANTLGNIGSPGTAIVFPSSSNVNNPSYKAWTLASRTLKFDVLPTTKVEIFALTGSRVATFEPASSIELNLQKGIYILRANNVSSKITIK